MKTILYTNENTKINVWQCETHEYVSDTPDDYETMLAVHQMLRESAKKGEEKDFVNCVRYLTKTNGYRLKDN